MMRPRSLRQRMPLEISAIVLVTGLGIAGVMLWFQYRALQTDMQGSAERLARVLAHAVAPDLAIGDRWAIYQSIKVLYTGPADDAGWLLPEFVLVLSANGHTMAASDPVRFHTGDLPRALGADLDVLLPQGSRQQSAGTMLTGENGSYWWHALRAGDTALGTLILGFAPGAFWSQFMQAAARLVTTIIAATVALLPLGWWLGRRMARPLEVLDDCVARLGSEPQLPLSCPVEVPYLELARLRERVERVAVDLEDRKRLERQVVRAEKQAMLGRLTAGVAHEINNPLGGMQAAIGMFKRHGNNPDVTRQTLSLLERGLEQISHIVSALLVEVKPEQRRLAPQDIGDIADLVAPILREREQRLEIDNRLHDSVAIPAGPVRQILLNLTLNALQAAPAGEQIGLSVGVDGDALSVQVRNSGPRISPERLASLFEPFDAREDDEPSLGLWLTHLTVSQLDGQIDAESVDGLTTFNVRLPMGTTS